MGRTLAGVWAHPDDECYAMYGTVVRHATDPGFRPVVVHATDGDAGEIAPGVPATPETLGAWRRAEDVAAWRALGTEPDPHVWLGHPDGRLGDVGDGLVDEVAEVLRAERPDVVVTFGPDGVTGHPDHVAIGATTERAFHRVRDEGSGGLHRLLFGCIPRRAWAIAQRYRAHAGLGPWDPSRVYELRSVPDDDVGIVVRHRDGLDRMLAAHKEHRSQRHVMFDPSGTDEQWKNVISLETWAVAWPPRDPGTAVLTDVFEGLA
ncbi:PIG-L deacetylase family protein [Knoellia sp. LjRoot47]|uniref:PIG-L deacetylase family protein n=1 Tax=Knoellia sp. LjRoot47 TaxID=3342330 RepID=UPI003ECCBC9C